MTTAGATAPACELRRISKRYGGVLALSGVDLRVDPGVVRGVVGENGAGKSTLMKILAGATAADQGTVHVAGQVEAFRSVAEANRRGVAIVFQELALFPELDVLANLFVGREPTRRGLVDRGQQRGRARPAMEAVGLEVPFDRPVSDLTLAEQQLLEIARGLLADARILILDEPNSALNAGETARLFAVVRRLKADGVAVLYISHRLEEVFEICDVITVMRNGRVVGEASPENATIRDVVSLILGTTFEPAATEARPSRTSDDGALCVESLAVPGKLEPLSFSVSRGEILGVAGLEGSGVREVIGALFAAQGTWTGRVRLPDGKPLPRSITGAVRAGIAYVPPDRRRQALMLDRSISDNIVQVSAGVLGRLGRWFWPGRIRDATSARAGQLRVKMSGPDQQVGELSGGNQQKVVLGRWLEADSGVLLLDDPTRGVDIGAKAEIYGVVRSFADAGGHVLFRSGELHEYTRVCDRVIVLYRGRAVASVPGDEAAEHLLLELVNTGRDPRNETSGSNAPGVVT